MPVATATHTETQNPPGGTLKLRGDVTTPATAAYPELDANGVRIDSQTELTGL